ncbi:MAG: hypothetical protein AAF696_11540 [Bacteroidota bacterium]
MKLSSADIRRLYGEKLFILAEKEASPTEEVAEVPKPEVKEAPAIVPPKKEPLPDLSPLKGDQAIIWKMKAGAKLALILHKSEFSNRELTSILKNAIVKAGIDPAWVGFGVIAEEGKALKLTDMSVNLALICDTFEGSLPSPAMFENKKIWLSANLSLIAKNPAMLADLEASLGELAKEI